MRLKKLKGFLTLLKLTWPLLKVIQTVTIAWADFPIGQYKCTIVKGSRNAGLVSYHPYGGSLVSLVRHLHLTLFYAPINISINSLVQWDILRRNHSTALSFVLWIGWTGICSCFPRKRYTPHVKMDLLRPFLEKEPEGWSYIIDSIHQRPKSLVLYEVLYAISGECDTSNKLAEGRKWSPLQPSQFTSSLGTQLWAFISVNASLGCPFSFNLASSASSFYNDTI